MQPNLVTIRKHARELRITGPYSHKPYLNDQTQAARTFHTWFSTPQATRDTTIRADARKIKSVFNALLAQRESQGLHNTAGLKILMEDYLNVLQRRTPSMLTGKTPVSESILENGEYVAAHLRKIIKNTDKDQLMNARVQRFRMG